MLESLTLRNFTAFSEAEFKFEKGLNVIVGENGTGKTHVLKVAYCAAYVGAQNGAIPGGLFKGRLQTAISSKLMGVFKPEGLGRLARRNRRGKKRCEVNGSFSPPVGDLMFSLHSASREVTVDRTPSTWVDALPVYLPTRELLTIYPGFVSLYETTHLPFEETWRDTSLLLGAPLARGPREKNIRSLLTPLEEAMGGNVELDDAGRFYLHVDGVSMEMHLVAEGLRKLAMLARLIATGALMDKGFLFWDEPEANLNPKIIKLVARTILHLCHSGIQVVLASHSLFLVRELAILLEDAKFADTPRRFFGLHLGDGGVEVQQGDSVDDIGRIAALEEELSQSDRYLQAEAN